MYTIVLRPPSGLADRSRGVAMCTDCDSITRQLTAIVGLGSKSTMRDYARSLTSMIAGLEEEELALHPAE
jgi:hypothetical protein